MRLSSVRRRFALPLIAFLALPVHLGAQESPLFTWTGRVDREVRLSIQGSNVSSNSRRGEEYSGRFRVASALPQVDGVVRVIVSGGRGDVSVIQQPNVGNNYTAVVRVVDRSSGADRYQVTAYFTPANAGRVVRGGLGNRNDNVYGNEDGRYGNNGRRVGQTSVLHWTGMVDMNAEVRFQNGVVRQRALDGNPLRSVRSSVSGNAGNNRRRQQATTATLNVTEARGQVDIVQQPNANNGYTTIIRINDPQGSYGRYTFDLTVQ